MKHNNEYLFFNFNDDDVMYYYHVFPIVSKRLAPRH